MQYKLGIIGAGKIGEAILAGSLAKGLLLPSEVILSVRTEQHRQRLEDAYHVKAVLHNREVAKQSEIILIAVKPRTIFDVLQEVGDVISDESVVVSTAAGVTLESMQTKLARKIALIRAMPNLGVSVGEGMTALAPARFTEEEKVQKAKRLFEAVGRALVLDEQYMDAVTGLSGFPTPAAVSAPPPGRRHGGQLQATAAQKNHQQAAPECQWSAYVSGRQPQPVRSHFIYQPGGRADDSPG